MAVDAIVAFRQLLEGGDRRGAQALLYQQHGQAVRRFVAARVPAGAVDDVCQEVWAAVVRGLDGYQLEAPPRMWVLGIARHKCQDAWRAHSFVESLDSQIGDGGPLAEVLGLRAPASPTRELSRHRWSVRVRSALAALREDERELLELRFVQGLKPAEIAMLLDAGANAISQRIVRAARRLRLLIEGDG